MAGFRVGQAFRVGSSSPQVPRHPTSIWDSDFNIIVYYVRSWLSCLRSWMKMVMVM